MEQNNQDKDKQELYRGMREAGMMVTAGVQGGGKTYQNMNIIVNYSRDKIATKVRGRKCLIFDPNGEYTTEEFAKNGHANFNAKLIAIQDVGRWCRDAKVGAECRRIDAKSLTTSQKKAALEYVMNEVKLCLLVLEDINTFVLKLTNMEEVIGKLVSLRHVSTDILMSFQSLRSIEPRIWQNARWTRLHKTAENVDEIKGKLTNYQLFKIAQIMIDLRFQKGDKRFFVYITNFGRKIEGAFGKKEFTNACERYLILNKKLVKEQSAINGVSEAEAVKQLTDEYIDTYYDNK